MSKVRIPAVAGMFYPDTADELRAVIDQYLQQAATSETITNEHAPKALIAPHAGYVYSGPVAASAYARLKNLDHAIDRVVLLGPAHRIGFTGIAAPDADVFRTPLGDVLLDQQAIMDIIKLPQVSRFDLAHTQEHSLEVQLPFLQETLGAFKLVPLVVGDATPEQVAEVIESLWGGAETLVVISSDLSHYLGYAAAQAIDVQTSAAIKALRPEEITFDQACGCLPVQGLLKVGRQHGMTCDIVDLRNSGDTAGTRDRVVGYGAYVFH